MGWTTECGEVWWESAPRPGEGGGGGGALHTRVGHGAGGRPSPQHQALHTTRISVRLTGRAGQWVGVTGRPSGTGTPLHNRDWTATLLQYGDTTVKIVKKYSLLDKWQKLAGPGLPLSALHPAPSWPSDIFFFVGFYTGHNIKLTREHTTEYTLLLLVTGEEKTCQEARGCGSVAAPSGTRPSATGCAGCNTDSLPNLNNFLGKIAYFFLKAWELK